MMGGRMPSTNSGKRMNEFQKAARTGGGLDHERRERGEKRETDGFGAGDPAMRDDG
jgi:hypothetical protein